MNISLDKIAPPVAFVIVGFLMILVGAAGIIPIGNSQPTISEPVKIIFIALGILLVVLGPLFVWREMSISKNSISPIDFPITKSSEFKEQRKISTKKTEKNNRIRMMKLFNDLVEYDIGLERIWPNRNAWLGDQSDGRLACLDRISRARNIDMMDSTLWTDWVRDPEFRKILFNSVKRGANVRILVYDPTSSSLRDHALDAGFTPPSMQAEIRSTLQMLTQDWQELNNYLNLDIRLTVRSLHWAQIVRFDEHLIVRTYLAEKSGGESPVMQLRGPQSKYFTTYMEQFEIMWERAKPLNLNHIQETDLSS